MVSSPRSDSLSFNLNSKVNNTVKQAEKFLQFQLGCNQDKSAILGDIALFSSKLVVEVININAADILPVPHMFYCILGTYSWRSEMLWIVDLENLLGYPPPLAGRDNQPGHLVMVVEFQGQAIGFVVSKIDNLVEYDREQFRDPSAEIFLRDVMPFLEGYTTDSSNQIVMLINVQKIFEFFSMKTEFNYLEHN